MRSGARKLSRVVFSSKVNTWGTPNETFKKLDRLIGFTLDACALPETAKVKRYVSPESDGLNTSWNNERVFDNFPYDQAGQWMPKSRNESLEVSALSANLVPYRGDTEWWSIGVLSEDGRAGRLIESYYDWKNRVWWLRFQRLVTGIHEYDGRLTFDGKTKGGKANNAPFPSAVVFHATPGLQPKIRESITTMWPRW